MLRPDSRAANRMQYEMKVKLFVEHAPAEWISCAIVCLYDRDRVSSDDALGMNVTNAYGEAVFRFHEHDCASPLPRAYQWADGSAYVNHVELVRKARGAEMPESFWTDPLMYQGGSDCFLAPHAPVRLADEAWGIDFEAEVAVITDDMRTKLFDGKPARCVLLFSPDDVLLAVTTLSFDIAVLELFLPLATGASVASWVSSMGESGGGGPGGVLQPLVVLLGTCHSCRPVAGRAPGCDRFSSGG